MGRGGPQDITAQAADLGITYGLEVINRYESNILNTALQVNGPHAFLVPAIEAHDGDLLKRHCAFFILH